MANPPQLTPEQRAAALQKAEATRKAQAEAKQKLKMGVLTLAQAFELTATDEPIARLKALSALEALPGVGKVTARRAMEEIGIAETKRLGGLGAQQRKALLERFGG